MSDYLSGHPQGRVHHHLSHNRVMVVVCGGDGGGGGGGRDEGGDSINTRVGYNCTVQATHKV